MRTLRFVSYTFYREGVSVRLAKTLRETANKNTGHNLLKPKPKSYE